MAFLLYRYIKKKRANAKGTSRHIPHLSQDSQAPLELSDGSSIPQEDVPGRKGANQTESDVPTISKEEKRAAKTYRWKLIAGLSLPFAVQALETTIVAGALPFIASDFNQLSQLNWIISAFNLCSATFIPMWGQVADVFGRYAALQSALAIMIIGSALSSGAPLTAFPMFLVGRALQGMGSAGCNIIVRTVLADKVSLEENAKNTTVFTIVAGVAYGIGPVIGGYLTQVTWRWCFIINIPIGVVALLLAHFVLRPELLGPQRITRTDGLDEPEMPSTFTKRLSTIDFGGQFLFLFGMGLLVLALTWGGSYYPWNDPKVLAPLIVGLILILLFLVWEYFLLPTHYLSTRLPYQKPMIPLPLLFTRNAGIIIYINFTIGMAMFAVFYFCSLYFTLVLNYSSSKSGTSITYYLPGLAFGAYSAIFLCNVYPKQTFHPLLLGSIITPVVITILAIALNNGNKNLIFGMLALTGVGIGVRFMPGTLHGVGYFPNQIASIVSLLLLSVSLGGTLGITVMTNVFNGRLRERGINLSGAGASLDGIAGLSGDQQSVLRNEAKGAISLAFWAVSAFLWLGLGLCVGLGNVDIGAKGVGRACRGSYLGSLLREKEATGEEEWPQE